MMYFVEKLPMKGAEKCHAETILSKRPGNSRSASGEGIDGKPTTPHGSP
jgi:hypothetical protein